MKTLSESDWSGIQSALEFNTHQFDSKFNTIEGIKLQIDETKVGKYIYYVQQNAPIEFDENSKIMPQYNDKGESIPLMTIVQCEVITQND
jgi:hypothetical protein